MSVKLSSILTFAKPSARLISMRKPGLFSILLLCMFSHLTSAQPPLRFCIDHYPPNHIFPDKLSKPHEMAPKDGQAFGFAITALNEVAERMDLSLQPSIDTPFKRCLEMMRKGLTDVMWGLLGNEERARYMFLIEYSGSSRKLFLSHHTTHSVIAKYEDLTGLTIGVVRGYKYFPEFDKEKTAFKKWPVNSITQGIQMLLRKRIDALIIREQSYRDLVLADPDVQQQLKVAAFVYDKKHPVHLGLSKQSPLANRYKDLESIIEEMVRTGRIDRIKEQFNHTYYGDASP